MFDLDTIVEGAKAQYGVENFGDDLYLPALREFLASLSNEAGLSEDRVMRTSVQLMMLLGERSIIHQALAAEPSISSAEVERPIFIVGLLRTGTTMLHNMLAAHPSHYAPPLWRLRQPTCPEGSEDQAIEDTRSILDLIYEMAPDFRFIHPMNALWPDECSWLFRRDFASMVNAFTYHVPSYAKWLLQTDMVPYYRSYKRVLQLLLSKQPNKRLVLKDPCHLWHLDALLEVFPDARVILLHRTIEEALPSMASLFFSAQRVGSSIQEPTQIKEYCLALAEAGLTRMMAARDRSPGAQILDMRYRDLVRDPGKALERICGFTGSSFDEESGRRMLSWLAENTQHKAGKHQYSLEQFGFTPQELQKLFGVYQERFLSGV